MSAPLPKGPLDGVRIIDLTTVMFGPYCTQILAEMGADVIKIEQPAGDTSRHVGPGRSPGMSGGYLTKARNKRSIMLDLKQDAAKPIFAKLIAGADAFVHNIRPKPAARIGIDYETVQAINKEIVYCAATGFRPESPYADKAAYDDLIQGLSGFASLNGKVSGGEPRYAPSVIVDKVSGLFASYAVMMALFHRERTGEGQRVDVGMFEAFTAFLMQEHLQGRAFEPPIGPAGYSRLLTTHRRPYKTADSYVCVVPYTDRHWRSFFRIVGRPELAADERFATIANRTVHIDALYEIVADSLTVRTTSEWLEALAEADIAAMPMHDVESVIDDPHIQAIGLFSEHEHPTEGKVRYIEAPVRLSKTPGGLRHHADRLGQSSVPILEEIGLNETEIEALIAAGVTKDGRPE
jgi:crotonobetainyl-CoA:carnitine CoA-transferase CaiB-like acyl-CoA transferase